LKSPAVSGDLAMSQERFARDTDGFKFLLLLSFAPSLDLV
jgi:hypothetical protein